LVGRERDALLVNPAHPDAARIVFFAAPERVAYDPRLR
jgi:hypothetical protein